MSQAFALYRLAGHRFVPGWLQPEVLDLIHTLDSVQYENQVSGAAAEIGVHHGKFFIALYLSLREQERALAIDIFGDQHLNLDGSGHGDFDKFHANVSRWASTENLVIHQGDSTQLDGSTVQKLARSAVRLFSVDGGHTEEVVLSDMYLAESALADGGIVIADDVFHQAWPGVAVGTLRYLQSGATLVPFAIGFNKVFFTQPEYAVIYRNAIEFKCGQTMWLSTENSTYAGHEVRLVFRTPRTPRRLLRKNATARTLYQSLVRGASS